MSVTRLTRASLVFRRDSLDRGNQGSNSTKHMSNAIVPNALDRAVMALQRSDSATPELYRQLVQGNLWFLVKYHPEIENQVIELKNGAPFPFIRVQEKEGMAVPFYSSEARLNESLEKGRVPAKTYSAASMPAQAAMQLLGHVRLNGVLNKGCSTGSLVLPPELMRDLANGKALAPTEMSGGETKNLTLTILDPADYPTNLVQPVFEVMRKHSQFRAAWIFGPPAGEAPTGQAKSYYLLVLMEPRDAGLFHDLNIVAQATRSSGFEVNLSLANEQDGPYITSVFKQARPFYLAAGYTPPTA